MAKDRAEEDGDHAGREENLKYIRRKNVQIADSVKIVSLLSFGVVVSTFAICVAITTNSN